MVRIFIVICGVGFDLMKGLEDRGNGIGSWV